MGVSKYMCMVEQPDLLILLEVQTLNSWNDLSTLSTVCIYLHIHTRNTCITMKTVVAV